jgi:hypothetical protein
MSTRLLSLVVAMAALVAAVSPVARGESWMSEYVAAGAATCRTNGIFVDAPFIKPKFVDYGMYVGGSQWTTFQSVLQRWDGRAWVDVYPSEWFHFESSYAQVDGDKFWYLDASQRWQYTTQGQTLPMAGRHGYFRYRLRVLWWDKYRGVFYGEESLVSQGMFDERGIDDRLYRSRDWCYYP